LETDCIKDKKKAKDVEVYEDEKTIEILEF
jgi:hypothetical protein